VHNKEPHQEVLRKTEICSRSFSTSESEGNMCSISRSRRFTSAERVGR